MENEKNEEEVDEDSEIEKSESEENSEINEENNKSEIHEDDNSKKPKKKKTDNKNENIEKQEIIDKKEDRENEELGEDKDLVEHAVKAVEYISSETAQEMDESAEIENTKKVEAALFIAGRFLTLQELVMLTDINPLMIKEILEKLIEKYNDNSGIEIIEKGDGWKMDVRQEHVSMINKLATGSAEFTKAEQETLAVIAYKQPVKQSVIIKIRGNKAYDHIKHFIDIGLVQAKKSGRTKELKLSDDFFEYFHLQKKNDGSTEIIGIEKDYENNNKSDNENISEEENTEKQEIKKEENNKEEESSKEQIDINENLEEDKADKEKEEVEEENEESKAAEEESEEDEVSNQKAKEE